MAQKFWALNEPQCFQIAHLLWLCICCGIHAAVSVPAVMQRHAMQCAVCMCLSTWKVALLSQRASYILMP